MNLPSNRSQLWMVYAHFGAVVDTTGAMNETSMGNESINSPTSEFEVLPTGEGSKSTFESSWRRIQ